MTGKICKGRRIYSLKPNKIVEATFARKYVNHFMPALLKIVNDEKRNSDENNGDCNCSEVYKKVRYEVDMALVMSTKGLFVWSHALKHNLQAKLNSSSLCSPTTTCVHQAAIFSMKIPPNPNGNPKILTKKLIRRPPRMIKREAAKKETKEEKLIGKRLMNLRSLLPGGSEMGADTLLCEVSSYIACLELQVNVLQCLTDIN